jgi:hypothetical protein
MEWVREKVTVTVKGQGKMRKQKEEEGGKKALLDGLPERLSQRRRRSSAEVKGQRSSQNRILVWVLPKERVREPQRRVLAKKRKGRG